MEPPIQKTKLRKIFEYTKYMRVALTRTDRALTVKDAKKIEGLSPTDPRFHNQASSTCLVSIISKLRFNDFNSFSTVCIDGLA